ncbi:hypothetical protein ACH4F6_30705 [Streptomyces sp. NPDC017936]|uniref:hypothetical protein n=1 Tax=Streptomyces sp. NPDC017936 TaxID=3365016 RepID=UPI0037A7D864
MIERNVTAVARQPGVQARTAWNYFDPEAFAQGPAGKVASAEPGGELRQGEPRSLPTAIPSRR